MMNILSVRPLAFAAVIIASTPHVVLAQDSLAVARDLYSSAAYEEALTVLNRLGPASPPSDRLAVNQYRSFCLVALRRNVEAEQAIEAVLADEPSYVPAEADASPRLLSAFAMVRQRVLPAIVQRKYAQAKARFDRQEFSEATMEFDQLLKVLNNPGVADVAGRPPLSDIRTLTVGFRDLSARATPPPPVAALVEAPAAPPPIPVAIPTRVYNSGDAQVAPPVIIRQEMPPLPKEVVFRGQGVLELVIDETGTVETATMRSPINPRYDRLVLAATKNWRFQPATVGGTAVKFRKMIAVRTTPE